MLFFDFVMHLQLVKLVPNLHSINSSGFIQSKRCFLVLLKVLFQGSVVPWWLLEKIYSFGQNFCKKLHFFDQFYHFRHFSFLKFLPTAFEYRFVANDKAKFQKNIEGRKSLHNFDLVSIIKFNFCGIFINRFFST